MSEEEMGGKGFDMNRKTKLIEENILRGHSQNTSISLKMTMQSNDNGSSGTKPLPAVLPWEGRLRNTCTIENFLSSCFTLFVHRSNPTIRNQRDLFNQRIL